jgi:hypothetical protein
VDQATISNSAQTTISELTFSDLASITAQLAGDAVLSVRWRLWKTEFLSSVLVAGFNEWLGVGKIVKQAIPTNANGS